MNKYEKALADLKNMVEVGGTLEEADEVVEVFEELIHRSRRVINALRKYDRTPKFDCDVAEDCVSRIKMVTGYEENSDIRAD